MSKTYKIKEVVEIISGMAFNPKSAEPDGNFPVINASNLKANSIIDDFSHIKVSTLPLRSPAVIKNNDVLMVSRTVPGNFFKASVIKIDRPAIATNSLYIFRPKIDELLSEYLNILINSSSFQKDVVNNSRGSSIFHISKKNLEEMKIPIPSLEEQKKLIELHKNIKQQKELTESIQKIKEEILQKTFTNLYKN